MGDSERPEAMASITVMILFALLAQANGQTSQQQATELLESKHPMAMDEEEEQSESEIGDEEEAVEPINLMATGEEEEDLDSETGEREDEAAPVRRLLDDAKLKRAPTAYISWF